MDLYRKEEKANLAKTSFESKEILATGIYDGLLNNLSILKKDSVDYEIKFEEAINRSITADINQVNEADNIHIIDVEGLLNYQETSNCDIFSFERNQQYEKIKSIIREQNTQSNIKNETNDKIEQMFTGILGSIESIAEIEKSYNLNINKLGILNKLSTILKERCEQFNSTCEKIDNSGLSGKDIDIRLAVINRNLENILLMLGVDYETTTKNIKIAKINYNDQVQQILDSINNKYKTVNDLLNDLQSIKFISDKKEQSISESSNLLGEGILDESLTLAQQTVHIKHSVILAALKFMGCEIQEDNLQNEDLIINKDGNFGGYRSIRLKYQGINYIAFVSGQKGNATYIISNNNLVNIPIEMRTKQTLKDNGAISFNWSIDENNLKLTNESLSKLIDDIKVLEDSLENNSQCLEPEKFALMLKYDELILFLASPFKERISAKLKCEGEDIKVVK